MRSLRSAVDSIPRSLARPGAIVLAGALLATLALTVSGQSRVASLPGPVVSTPPPPPRTGGDLSSFQGMGTWVDIYDSSWSHPRAAVTDMAARGVRTLYLETSNFNRPSAFVYRDKTATFVDAAHDDGIRIVAWYLPGFVDVNVDLRRALAAVRFRTARGNGFDAFGLDIESPEVRDPAIRSRRLLDLSARLRASAGDYPLGAIIPSPRGMVRNATYWPDFPYANLAAVYDLFMPMTYYTWRVSGAEGARSYTAKNINIIRSEVGTDQEPVHVIGGIANDSSNAETRGFVRAVREHGIVGASFYTFPTTQAGEWPILQQIPSNPMQTPALPAPLGSPAMGNIPGQDATHPHDVVFHTGRKAGTWTLSARAFDAQDGEIRVLVNWVSVGVVPAGPEGDWSGSSTLSIPDAALNDDAGNVIVFTVGSGDGAWGVADVSLTPAT
jgi:hypothetical protein